MLLDSGNTKSSGRRSSAQSHSLKGKFPAPSRNLPVSLLTALLALEESGSVESQLQPLFSSENLATVF